MSTAFVPPKPSEWQGPAQGSGFTPPPPTAWQGPAPERTFTDAVKDAGSAFWEWTGKPVADAIGLSSGTEAERAAKAREAQSNIVKGIMNEPARVRQEVTNALDAFVAGNPRATLHHVLTAVPLVGEGINQAAQEFNRGEYAKGVGHMGAIVAPAVAKEAPAIAGGARAVGTAAKDVAGSWLPESSPISAGNAASNPIVHRVAKFVANKIVPGSGNLIDIAKLVKQAMEDPATPPAPGEVPPPGAPPAGFNVAQGSTVQPAAQGPPRTPGYQPPVTGQMPAQGPPEAPPVQAQPQPPTAPPAPPQGPPVSTEAWLQSQQPNGPAGTTPVAPAVPPAPPPAAPRVPVRPPLAQMTRPQIIEAAGLPADATPQQIAQAVAAEQTPPAATAPGSPGEPPPPPARTLPQINAGMARTKPAPVDPGEARSIYDEQGNLKSSQQRGVEKTAANRAAKAQRFAQALHDAGITATDAGRIEAGQLSDAQIQQGQAPRWGNIAQSLGEDAPSEFTMPQIVKQLKALEAAKAPVEAPGPVAVPSKRAPGGGMGGMKNYFVPAR